MGSSRLADLAAPWSLEQLDTLCWAQGGDTMVLTHAEIPPRLLLRILDSQGRAGWVLRETPITQEDAAAYHGSWKERWFGGYGSYWRMPSSAAWPDSVTWDLYRNGGGNDVTTFDVAPIFLGKKLDTYKQLFTKSLLRYVYEGKAYYFYIITVEFVSYHRREDGFFLKVHTRSLPDAVRNYPPFRPGFSLTDNGSLSMLDFSSNRGWPRVCLFHQGRLILAGTKGRPNRVWISHVHDFWNFDLGDSLDDEAVVVDISEKTVDPVRELFSARDLHIFTDEGEWSLRGRPLTPQGFSLLRETTHGIYGKRRITPCLVEGATLFVERSGKILRELYYDAEAEVYIGGDLSILNTDLLAEPLEQFYDGAQHLVYVVCADGHIAALTVYRSHSVSGWSRLETAGRFRSGIVVGDVTYFLVERTIGDKKHFFLECFKDDLFLDSALELALKDKTMSTKVWQDASLSRFGSGSFAVLTDGKFIKNVTLASRDSVKLNVKAAALTAGYAYTHCVAPLPVMVAAGPYRPLETVFRLHQTGAFAVDYGRGVQNISLPFKAKETIFSGPVTLRSDGWRRDEAVLWRIEQDSPHPFHLLSVKSHIKVVG